MSSVVLGRASWRVPLRMARRTARREPGRALMVILLIAFPVAAVAGSVITGSTSAAVPLRAATVALGQADGMMAWSGVAATAVSAFGAEAPVDGQKQISGAEPTSPLASLPAGSTAATRLTGEGNIAYDGRPFRHVTLVEADLANRLFAGSYTLTAGRLPTDSREALVSQELAARIGLGKDADVTIPAQGQLPATDLRVVGVYRDNAHRNVSGTLITKPGALHLETTEPVRQYWVAVPGGLGFSQVLNLGQHGWRTLSRDVLANPPAGCTGQQQFCDAHGPVQAVNFGDSVDTGTATVVALATVMALLQIVLLVGPAFAVGLRRRRRDLGLLAVSGARPGQLRRVVLAEGVVLGVLGAGVGLVIAWIGVYVLRGTLERGGNDHWLGLPVVSPLILVVAAFGLGTAVVAAAQPARQAARTDAVSAVGRGSLHLTTRAGTRRLRVLGGLAVVLGTALVIGVGVTSAGGDGVRTTTKLIPLLAGCIAAELGVVTLTPTLIELVSRLAQRLPLTPRLALRDAARNRLRSGAAVAAVTAAMAASVAALLYSTSTAAAADRAYQPRAPLGSVMVALDGTPDVTTSESIRSALGRVLPLKASWTVPLLSQAAASNDPAARDVQLVVPPEGRCPTDTLPSSAPQATIDAAVADPRCHDDRQYGFSIFNGVPVGDADLLAAITGVDDPVARQTLDAGGAVVFSKNLVSAGQVTLTVGRSGGDGQDDVVVRELKAPAAVVGKGFPPGQMFLSKALAARLGVPAQSTTVYGTLAHPVSGGQVDRANAAISRLTGDDQNTAVSVELGRSRTSTDLLLTAIVLVAALLAGAAAVTAGGLALADSRADLSTLAAVGAPPRVRRRLAAAQAGVLTLIGCALGVGAGFLPGWAMVHATEGPVPIGYATFGNATGPIATPLVVPWAWIALLTVGLPVLTAGVVGLAVRSRIQVGRRGD